MRQLSTKGKREVGQWPAQGCLDAAVPGSSKQPAEGLEYVGADTFPEPPPCVILSEIRRSVRLRMESKDPEDASFSVPRQGILFENASSEPRLFSVWKLPLCPRFSAY
jgi:hypothetical protein